ncbi:MAG TPA: hypothetical protein VG713_01865 [Pirellulales bacterium]|nr:hypothetical protein [Pirellulales bacterium]
MDRAPIDRELLKKLDACRPGSTDHPFAEASVSPDNGFDREDLDSLRDHVARIDRAIAAALHDAPIPAGLSDRLKAAVAAAALSPTAVSPVAVSPVAVSPVAAAGVVQPRGLVAQELPKRSHRRRWVVGATTAALACAASALIAWCVWPSNTIDLGPEAIMNVALNAAQQAAGEASVPVSAASPPAQYRVDGHIVAGSVAAWHRLSGGFLERDGVAYRLVGRQRERASLFVVDLQGPLGAPHVAALPTTPLECVLTTGGRTSAIWSDGRRLFVLVVDGDASTLRSFIHEPGAIA